MQKKAVLICFVAEAWNYARYFSTLWEIISVPYRNMFPLSKSMLHS